MRTNARKGWLVPLEKLNEARMVWAQRLVAGGRAIGDVKGSGRKQSMKIPLNQRVIQLVPRKQVEACVRCETINCPFPSPSLLDAETADILLSQFSLYVGACFQRAFWQIQMAAFVSKDMNGTYSSGLHANEKKCVNCL